MPGADKPALVLLVRELAVVLLVVLTEPALATMLSIAMRAPLRKK